MDLCPFYCPHHKGGIVRENVFKDCLTELREREQVTRGRLERERDEARQAYEAETLSTAELVAKNIQLEKAIERSGGLHGASCCAVWTPGDHPNTPKGSSTLMWVTMRSKRNGKLTVGVMTYHNGHVMPCSDQCDPPDCAVPHNPEEDGYCEDYEWTCWSNGSCNHCETEWMWDNHDWEIVAHAIVTKPEPFEHNVELMRGRNNH